MTLPYPANNTFSVLPPSITPMYINRAVLILYFFFLFQIFSLSFLFSILLFFSSEFFLYVLFSSFNVFAFLVNLPYSPFALKSPCVSFLSHPQCRPTYNLLHSLSQYVTTLSAICLPIHAFHYVIDVCISM